MKRYTMEYIPKPQTS